MNGCLFVYELSGCGFESRCSHIMDGIFRIIRIILLQLIGIISSLGIDMILDFLNPAFCLLVTVRHMGKINSAAIYNYQLSTGFSVEIPRISLKILFQKISISKFLI